ncbi:patatin-like phospholipase family protein [Agrobacterium tumefaciens]|uniref:patatin-like phospholipase family protein n=1 Tax=Agrobacterium tumefaciens TaxID=358 RepID=UPI001BB7C006|nr:patatin-like phospholipase family protein [Agrobacterium tumefaciens]QTK81959.1 patatin-like phospholipase family protein [Agrobacterium tumefaciens]
MGHGGETAVSGKSGIGLCLSGGGYRAMVFHLGALLRLNEAGLLKHLSRVSSVSGGSITAAYLGLRWKDLDFDPGGRANALDIVVDKIREMASTTIDAGAILGGILMPGSISDRVAAAYDRVLFHGAGLDHLPDDDHGPRFVINATNVQTGALWRFSQPYMGDYRVGLVANPKTQLSLAVAASSAFPPVLSPLTLDIDEEAKWDDAGDLPDTAFRGKVVLSDGGVYDNLGLEPVIKSCRTVLVSDAGQKISPEVGPHHDWARHSIRILDIVDNQVRSLRKRALIDSYQARAILGCYWGIRSDIKDYALVSDPLAAESRDPSYLAAIPTRLQAMPGEEQERLINWGYAVTDAALRKHFAVDLEAITGRKLAEPEGFPYRVGY